MLFAVSTYSFKISPKDYCPPKPTTMNPFDASKVPFSDKIIPNSSKKVINQLYNPLDRRNTKY